MRALRTVVAYVEGGVGSADVVRLAVAVVVWKVPYDAALWRSCSCCFACWEEPNNRDAIQSIRPLSAHVTRGVPVAELPARK